MKNALFIHAGALGDFILALRVVQAMKSAGSDRVVALARGEIAAIGLSGGVIDGVLDIEVGGHHALFSNDAEIPPAARRALQDFDWAVCMAGDAVARRLRELG